MTAAAEQQIISVASQKEAHMNVQQIVDKHTKELRVSRKWHVSVMLSLLYNGLSLSMGLGHADWIHCGSDPHQEALTLLLGRDWKT